MRTMWVYAGSQGMVNATALPLADGRVLVVDTGGTPADGEFFAKRVAAQGESVFAFITHEHGDHTQGNRYFACPIISSIQAKQAMSRAEGTEAATLPNVTFGERLELSCGEPLVMQWMGGHCPGAAVLWLPQRKLLFTGDLVFNGRWPWMGQADFQRWIDNLNQLLAWDAETVVPGHGPVGGKEILAKQRDFLVDFLRQVRQAKQRGLSEEQTLAELFSRDPRLEHWRDMLRRAIQLALSA